MSPSRARDDAIVRAMTRYIVLAAALVACDGGTMQMPDAKMVDAGSTNKVVDVTCPATPDATVITTDASSSYMPMATTISVNGVVKFTTSLSHNVVPNSLATLTDPGLNVGFNTTKCLKFTMSGTYGFRCGPHSFVGTVTVN